MSTELEKFIRENKKGFDVCEPPTGLWDKIEQGLDEQKTAEPKKEKVIRLSFLLKIAATVIVVLGAGFLYGNTRTM